MKKLLIAITLFTLIINNESSYALNYEYKIKRESIVKISQLIDLGDKDDSINNKNPILAAGLSFVIPGSGQIYNGEIIKGIAIFIGVIGLGLLDYFIIEPTAKQNEISKKSDSLFDLGALATRISLPTLWVYGWGSAYQSSDPVYQKKIKDEEKLKKENEANKTSANLSQINLISYKF